jgi:hypothetical protein
MTIRMVRTTVTLDGDKWVSEEFKVELERRDKGTQFC